MLLCNYAVIADKIIISNFEEFKQYDGKEVGVSDYLTVDQARIKKFAEATSDYQWIHLDQKRAEKESPFGTTIAHGYLTMCLIPYFLYEMFDFPQIKMGINYGINNMKLMEPVKVNSKIRLRVEILSVKNLRGTIKATMKITLEIQGIEKPACRGEVTYLYQF